MPLMELPHTGQLTAWRDPWFVEQGDGAGRPWTMLIGSGLRGAGGTALVYRTMELTRGGSGGGKPRAVGGECLRDVLGMQCWRSDLCAHSPNRAAGWTFVGHLCSYPSKRMGVVWWAWAGECRARRKVYLQPTHP